MMLRNRILIVVGTRPEAIKMAPLVRQLKERPRRFDVALALSGQHSAMVDQVLDVFDMKPDFDLEIMQPQQTLFEVVNRSLDGLGSVISSYEPDVVLVQGDTATVFAGALASFFHRTLVGHVEAGLRSGDKWAPFPEEVLRRLTDVLSDFYFAPTEMARTRLLHEGVPDESIHVTGNTVVDALLWASSLDHEIVDPALQSAIDSGNRLVLLTVHRRESFGGGIQQIFSAVRDLEEAHEDIVFVYPVHPNPKVAEPARRVLGGRERILLTEPLGYLDLVAALKSAALVMTDSGGIQEEAPTFGTPVLVLREVTERPEGVAAGVSTLVGTERGRIVSVATELLKRQSGQEVGETPLNPYGDGTAAIQIADILDRSLAQGAHHSD